MFFHFISTWPPDVYNIEVILNAILDKLDRDRNNKILLESLGLLWVTGILFSSTLAVDLLLSVTWISGKLSGLGVEIGTW